jgi:hypothetical protein
MPNHVHLIAIPSDENSLAVLLRRVHGRYAQYYNAKAGRIGHLWQNRYFSCMLGPGHLVRALLYVDLNPVRAAWCGVRQAMFGRARQHMHGARMLLDLWIPSAGGDWRLPVGGRRHSESAQKIAPSTRS